MGNNSIDIYGDMPKAIAGAKYGLHDETETFIAGEKIFPGDPCFGMVGEGSKCYGQRGIAYRLRQSGDRQQNRGYGQRNRTSGD